MIFLYCIYDSYEPGALGRLKHFRRAARALGVRVVELDSRTVDHSVLPTPSEGDLLYNVTRGSYPLETLLLNRAVTTFYRQFPSGGLPLNDTVYSAVIHQREGLLVPRTVFHATAERALLETYVDLLGGFPVIIKVAGGTLGIGTLIAPDSESLFSLCDHLVATDTEFILRQYVKSQEIARLIVVGDEVVASNAKLIPKGDFRSSVKHHDPVPMTYGPDVESVAVRATVLSNVETAGVDILISQDGIPYLLEINTPHNFVTTSRVTGVDVASLMVSHLLSKARP